MASLKTPADIVIASHLGGLNEDPPNSLRENECVQANNVEFWQSMLGERRAGCTALDLTSSGLTSSTTICFISQWFPTNVVTLPEFIFAAAVPATSIAFARRDTAGAWHTLAASDTVDFTAATIYAIVSQALNGLNFLSYKSNVDRLHLVDTAATMRRAGIAAPVVPTAADSATGGTFQGTRYYRQRSVVVAGSTVTIRSEPSTVLTFTPSKTKNGAVVTKGADQSGETSTHWELEASLDNANFYRIARTINATTTFSDTTSGPKTYPNSPPAAPVSTDGTSITYALLSDQAAQLNLTGTVSNGQYSDGTNIASRGWIGYTSADVYIPLSTSMAWSVNSSWFASPDVATVLETSSSGGSGQDYADVGTLSEAIGAYLTIGAAKYVTVDGDRLIYGGHWTDATKMSTVGWTPQSNDPGVGNTERAPIVTTGGEDIVTTQNLDNYDGGALTGLAPSTLGNWFAFKWQRIYAAQRTREVTNAYDIQRITSSRGAIPGSIIIANDAHGNTVIYFLDPFVGPCQMTTGGIIRAIRGFQVSWERVNLKATSLVCCGAYYPRKEQVQWTLSVDGGNTPTLGLGIQTDELKEDEEGYLRGGLFTFDGKKAQARAMAALTLTSGNLTTDVPVIGLPTADFALITDSGTKDNTTSFVGSVVGRPRYAGGLLQLWQSMKAALLVTADALGSVRLDLLKNQGSGIGRYGVATSCAPGPANEAQKTLVFDNEVLAEASCIQVRIIDGDVDKDWAAQRVDISPMPGGDA